MAINGPILIVMTLLDAYLSSVVWANYYGHVIFDKRKLSADAKR